MSDRIQLVIGEEEKERLRRRAQREGKTLSAWLRDAAREKLARSEERASLDTVERLRDFFSECRRREGGREPDWEEHRRVIQESVRDGSPSP